VVGHRVECLVDGLILFLRMLSLVFSAPALAAVVELSDNGWSRGRDIIMKPRREAYELPDHLKPYKELLEAFDGDQRLFPTPRA
jgi:hypothetical protein